MKDPQPIEIGETEVEQLIEKTEQGTLDAAKQKRLVPLLRTLIWIQRTLLSTLISLSRLKRILFGKKTEKRPRKPKDPDSGSDGGGTQSGGNPDTGGGPEDPPAGSSGMQPGDSNTSDARGHGRRAAADYAGAETVSCPHAQHQQGGAVPAGCTRWRRWCACVLPVSPWHG